jgi:hypothetical protein
MMAGDPHHGGATWAILQYVLGFERLGYDVYMIEPLSRGKLERAGAPLDHSENAAYFGSVTEAFGIQDRCALLLEGSNETVGLPYSNLQNIAADADVLINVSGMLQREELTSKIPVRIYLDLDPGFNQLWHAAEAIDMRFAGHNVFVTVGNAIGKPGCAVPTCGLDWIATLQPVVLDYWQPAGAILYDAFTTVANWRGYGSIHHDGVVYGQKAHSFREFMDVPTRTAEKFMLALSIHPDERKDLDALSLNGWALLDPNEVANTPGTYRKFVQGSKAEFGVAKSGYVASRCGWFSDRSACYLASGRPVVAQETGFGVWLPCGEGLLPFSTREEALAAVEAVNRDYARHARAARRIAAEYFESSRVLSSLMAKVGLPA